MDNVVYFKKYPEQCPELYPEQYPVPYPDQKQTEFADVLDRGWDTFKKQSEEMSKYDYVFPGWWSSSRVLGMVGVPDVFRADGSS